ncbi:hypothetical protein M434DRAFT_32574 [Hypoxylon sp. CO27-5]|nr:hypothetical protein M434DRAFT_32574 [Hypoxylon sp. CO27-5]
MSSQASPPRRHHCDDPSKCYYCRRKSSRLAAGQCITCSNPLAPGNRNYCANHVDKNKRRNRTNSERRSELGQCRDCRSPTAPGRSYCEPCLHRRSESQRRRRERKKEEKQPRQATGMGPSNHAHDSDATYGYNMSQPTHPSQPTHSYRPIYTSGETSNEAYAGPSAGTGRQRSSHHVQNSNQYELQGGNYYGTKGNAHHNVQNEAQHETDDDRVYANVLLLRDYCNNNP